MMDTYLLDWANLLLRWVHVITAIAWVGSSFYFVWLDNHLTPPEDEALKAKGVSGELWAVHGGGFYNPQKYAVGPRTMPTGSLHWFFWESYSTWLSGFALFTVLYLFNASSFLVDPRVHDWSPTAAVLTALGFLVAGWLVYDTLCRLFGRKPDGSIGGDLRVGVMIFVYVVVAAWAACQLFSGRGAFLLMGAMLATIMSANVLFWIIPGQRTVVADLAAGRTPDPVHGQRGKQRSVHNTYFTLPVLVAMLSNHYSMLYSHPHNWVVLVGLMLLGALVRQWFVLRHKGRARWELVLASAVLLAGLLVLVAPSVKPVAAGAPVPTLAEVNAIVQQRCVMCHNAALSQKGVQLHTPELVVQHAPQILQQAVIARTMPLNNATQITDDERAVLKRWIEAGARP
jgi:uncharacterized membrane protein